MSFGLRELLRRWRSLPVPHLAPRPGIKDCCLDPHNRVLMSIGVATNNLGERSPTEMRRCKVCGCNHHRIFAGKRLEPGKVGIGA